MTRFLSALLTELFISESKRWYEYAMDERIAQLDAEAEALAPHYSRFLSSRKGEALLTAHSHQAWPDISREGQLACWDDAARLIDGKWDQVLGEVLSAFQRGVAERIGTDRAADLTIAPNTHELVFRLLSCFPQDAHVLTTNAEFHSLRRQLSRLMEDGLSVTQVAVEEDFEARFIEAAQKKRPALVALSMVLFTNSKVIRELPRLLTYFAEQEIPVLVDAYHAFNALEMEVDAWPGTVFVVGGGYKYAQSGEGTCWMLLPKNATRFRPRNTGWFADFESLEAAEQTVGYGPGGFRFFGSTFDPSGIYRGVWVMRWMKRQGLSPRNLRARSLSRTGLIIDEFDRLGFEKKGLQLATPREDSARGGFIALKAPQGDQTAQSLSAGQLSAMLRARGVHTDARGPLLRLGPGPYAGGRAIRGAMETLANLCDDATP